MSRGQEFKEFAWEKIGDNFKNRAEFNRIWSVAGRLARKVGFEKIGQTTKLQAINLLLVNDFISKGNDSLLSYFKEDTDSTLSNRDWKILYRQNLSAQRFEKFAENYGDIEINFGGGERSFNDVYADFINGKITYTELRDAFDLVKASPKFDGKFKHMGDTT